MYLPLTDPSAAYALGQLADLLRERRTVTETLAQNKGDSPELQTLLTARAHARAALQAVRLEVTRCARLLASHNQAQAELMPRLSKLKARAEALRLAQVAQSDGEAARTLRRSRAQMAVQIEDVQREVDAQATHATAVRGELVNHQTLAATNRDASADIERALAGLQRQRAGIGTWVQAVMLDVMVAHATLRVGLGQPGPHGDLWATWQQAMGDAGRAWRALHARMLLGEFAQEDVDALLGGRAPLTGQMVWVQIALGDIKNAREAFSELCAGHDFLHHIFYVFCAFCAGLLVEPDHAALAEALRLHRLSQGLRGALADCLWAYLHRDKAAFTRALPQVVQLDAATWQRSVTPAMGLVSVLGLALVHLGQKANLPIPKGLGPTVPMGLWSVAGDGQVG
jgi:hypothetical protein